MMLYTGREQDTRAGDAARAVREERRTFTRRIDCDSSPRHAASYAPARGGAPRDRDGWERSRRGYGG
jgi:hypothetical protein